MVDNYNMTFMDTAANFHEILIGVNAASGGIIMPGVLLAVFIIIAVIMHLAGSDTIDVVLADSFIVSILAVFFFVAGYIGGAILAIPLVMLVASVFIKIFSR